MKGKTLLAGILSAMMVLSTMPLTAFAETGRADISEIPQAVSEPAAAEGVTVVAEGETAVAKVGETAYDTLKGAVEAAQETGATVTLQNNASGDGIEVGANKSITIDFNNYTYTVTGNLVGDIKTNAFRFLENANVTLKNGTINLGNNINAKILVQNYSNLTLENMTLDFKKYLYKPGGYTLSCNKGNTIIKGNTNIISPKGKYTSVEKLVYAINIYNDENNHPVSLTIDETMTGTVTGNVEVSGVTQGEDTQKLVIKGGTYTGVITDNRDDKNKDVTDIFGGTFTNKKSNVEKYVADGYIVNPATGMVSTFEDSLSKEVTVSFKKEKTSEYGIYIDTVDGKMINGLLSADLTFALTINTQDDKDALKYTIKPADDMKLIESSDNRFEFHYNGTDISQSGIVNKVKIGTVVFEGYCNDATFAVVNEATNIVNTTKLSDSIVDSYIPTGDTTNTGKFTVTDKSKINLKISKPNKTLTVKVAFPNNIVNNAAKYQDMTVTVSGGDLDDALIYELGSDTTGVTYKDNSYTLKIRNKLTQNTAYTVTVTGAGYRTARYTVTMTKTKTLNFWNNAKDADAYIEESVGMPKKTNFLAGDIVKDGKINIYDLSAVVSYFGTINNIDAKSEYAKYDLNRDGKIDSKDVAYLLVSWGM